MTTHKFYVLLYFNDDFQPRDCGSDDTCENICRELCKENNFKPVSNTLFSLRIKKSKHFLPPSTKVVSGEHYEFRIRYKLPNLSSLKPLDRNAFNYLYHQTKYDLINNTIPELEYPNHKEKVVGLGVTNMYIDMLERNFSIEECEKNYKNYLPVKHIKKHMFIIKKKVSDELRNIKNMDHDVNYVKSTYVETIISLAPTYLIEKYTANASYPAEDGLKEGTCPVELLFSPYDNKNPGFTVHYFYNNKIKHIGQPQDVYAILIDNDIAKLEFRDFPNGFKVQIADPQKMGSFISCITGYYRLMVKWTVDICEKLQTPSLQELRKLGCHGPIGGDYSYNKLQERQHKSGSYIIRQCEKVYGDYYIDIMTKTDTIVTHRVTNDHGEWNLHFIDNRLPEAFDTLEELAKSIRTDSGNHYKIIPADYDNSHLLLLCFPQHQLATTNSINAITESELRKKRPELLDLKCIRKYIASEKLVENGVISEMKADWLLPEHKKLEVTMKSLKMDDKLGEFLLLAENWSRLNSPELIKLFGFTITSPHIYVIESIRQGPLNEFLRTHEKTEVKPVCLIDAAYTLARALHYLQEQNIVHGRIRCHSLFVVRYEHPEYLLVRLGEPGFQKTYSSFDKPWIPFEYQNNPNQGRSDFKADIFAYATTLWEIFTRGETPRIEYFSSGKRRPQKPVDCLDEIYKIMLSGWHTNPSKRFSPQEIFTTLITSRLAQNNLTSSNSVNGIEEEHDLLIPKDNESISSMSSDEISTDSVETDALQFSQATGLTILSHDNRKQEDYGLTFEVDNGGIVVLLNQIGSGHYGKVFSGTYECNNTVTDVAIKQLKAQQDENIRNDFKRESNIMKELQHPNIVKIITWIEQPYLAIVMEYIKHRSFLTYLNSSPALTVQHLLKFAKEIASGMEYLAKKKIVHRDLAARNILVDTGEVIKISDFGLAQIANEFGYYVMSTLRDIPIKWYAPESIREGKYSQYSDVWSYGVTLFEMFSRGQEPNLIQMEDNSHPSQFQILEALDRGERLRRPELCPQDIYDKLMMECWRDSPKQRPDFSTILHILNGFIKEYGVVKDN